MTDEAILFVIDKFMKCYDLQAHDQDSQQHIADVQDSVQGPIHSDNVNINTNHIHDGGDDNDANAGFNNSAIDNNDGNDADMNADADVQTSQEWQEWRLNQIKAEKSRQLFEGCISREKAFELAAEFAKVFGDDRVIDAVMFTGMKQLGLYEILVSCAACAAEPSQFDPPGPWIVV
ncbi:hypothetical protein RFI_33402 [Reticulomyxa filosa]|uniref:Uncharacterized protein n=1 Tax=Reticulomyxa filosa TaxID=46433 RepID=X6LTE0_RETFI|nr:hypothetical protein RFI_33402 [Reticulomyxa filosa]|eukprot:ETO04000.1 hypothetical protein RFI_33402 [Reticulomyxa filosa]